MAQEKAEVNPSQSLLAVDLIFSHLLKSLYPCNFEVRPAKGFEKACNLPTMTRQRISQALQDRVERGRKRAGGGVAPFPQGLCMCEQLSLWPELWGINKLLRKQRTDLQPLFHEFRRNQFTARELRGAANSSHNRLLFQLKIFVVSLTKSAFVRRRTFVRFAKSRKHASAKGLNY